MSEKKTPLNFRGIAALITAVAGLVGAFSIFPQNSKSLDQVKPIDTSENALISGSKINNDFCVLVNKYITEVPNDFVNIIGDEDLTNGQDKSTKYFYSKVNFPQVLTNTIQWNKAKDSEDSENYISTIVFIKTVSNEDSDFKYKELQKKLYSCLRDPFLKSSVTHMIDETLKSETYSIPKVKAVLQLNKIDNIYTVELEFSRLL